MISDIGAQPIKNPAAAKPWHSFWMDLHVELLGDEIVVTRPETDFPLAYRKRIDRPSLIVTRSWGRSPHHSPAVSEFRAQAFEAANAKARELG